MQANEEPVLFKLFLFFVFTVASLASIEAVAAKPAWQFSTARFGDDDIEELQLLGVHYCKGRWCLDVCG